MHRIYLMLFLAFFPYMACAEWRAVYDLHPVTKEAQCLLVSKNKKLFDGQEYSNVKLMLNKDDLFVITDSNIDMSVSGLGIKVDKKPFVPFSNVMAKKNVVFADYSRKKVTQLRKGHRATLGLGFWPSWPKTQLRKIKFDLRGFSRAHENFLQCLEDSH